MGVCMRVCMYMCLYSHSVYIYIHTHSYIHIHVIQQKNSGPSTRMLKNEVADMEKAMAAILESHSGVSKAAEEAKVHIYACMCVCICICISFMYLYMVYVLVNVHVYVLSWTHLLRHEKAMAAILESHSGVSEAAEEAKVCIYTCLCVCMCVYTYM
jgi:hypothetical protein